MPCEMIHTKARKLLGASWWAELWMGRGKYGVVAKSRALPAALERTMISLSKFAAIAQQDMPGAQFKYFVDFADGHVWHILSCLRMVRGECADDKQRVLAHHLAFTEREVQAIWSKVKRITPADVLLQLMGEGFWVETWQGEPMWMDRLGEPEFLANEAQDSTWEAISGRRNNKFAFCREPYNRACLVVLPTGSDLFTILNMLRESDLCLPDMGWGHSFITHGALSHVPSMEARVFTLESNSPLVSKALRLKHPVLTVTEDLYIPPVGAREADNAPLRTMPPAAPAPVASIAPQRPPSTNFAPLNLGAKTQVIRKETFMQRVLRRIGRALLTLLRDIKDFILSFAMGFAGIALIACTVMGLAWLIVTYLIPLLKSL